MPRTLTYLLSLLCAFALGALWAQPPPVTTTPKVASVEEMIKTVPTAPNLPIRTFAQGADCTVNIVTPTEPLKPHLHKTHEEVAYVIRGKGKMRLGSEVKEVKAGDLTFIPKNTVHTFTPESKDGVTLSIFAPAFDGKDRVFVDQ